jgi:hypothetical protein
MIACSVDLILTMGELFDITLQPELSGDVMLEAALDAFEAYQSPDHRSQELYDDIRALVDGHHAQDTLRREVKQLVEKYSKHRFG